MIDEFQPPFNDKIQFVLIFRVEYWDFCCKFPYGTKWEVLKSFKKKPSDTELEELKELSKNAFKAFNSHILETLCSDHIV